MIRIKLRSKFLYEIKGEEHFEDTYIDVGYKNQIYLITIIKERYCKQLIYADALWHIAI